MRVTLRSHNHPENCEQWIIAAYRPPATHRTAPRPPARPRPTRATTPRDTGGDKLMRKIPTVFLRDWDGNPRHVTREPNPECAWVHAGEGTATRKLDGTCVRFDGERWWARREVKADKQPPPGFTEISLDNETGKTIGYEPAEQSGFAKWIQDAVDAEPPGTWPVGTYELCGPKVNGNPEQYSEHLLIPHTMTDVLPDAPRDYDSLATWLHNHPYEGIVWHHEDGRRMAKLKARDLPTEPTTPGRGDE